MELLFIVNLLLLIILISAYKGSAVEKDRKPGIFDSSLLMHMLKLNDYLILFFLFNRECLTQERKM